MTDKIELIEVEVKVTEVIQRKWLFEVPASMADDYDAVEQYFEKCVQTTVPPCDDDPDLYPTIDIEFV